MRTAQVTDRFVFVNGFLILDKPTGPTSHDMVARVRRLLARNSKVGHTGTLDPLASGVLPLAIGHATRLADELRDADKGYVGVIQLGITTDSDDAEGSEIARAAVPALDEQRLAEVIAPFRGAISQIPPAYSAIHVDGKRAYDLARRGEQVVLAARNVIIHALTASIIGADQIQLEVRCSKGTYIRSLARDIGAALGCGGHLAQLRRTLVGPFSLADAVKPDDLAQRDDIAQRLLPSGSVLQHWTAVELTAEQQERVRRGMPLTLQLDVERVAAYRAPHELMALLERVGEQYQPRKVFG